MDKFEQKSNYSIEIHSLLTLPALTIYESSLPQYPMWTWIDTRNGASSELLSPVEWGSFREVRILISAIPLSIFDRHYSHGSYIPTSIPNSNLLSEVLNFVATNRI